MGVKRGGGAKTNAAGSEKTTAKIRRFNASQQLIEDPKAAWSEAISDMSTHVQRFREWWKLDSNCWDSVAWKKMCSDSVFLHVFPRSDTLEKHKSIDAYFEHKFQAKETFSTSMSVDRIASLHPTLFRSSSWTSCSSWTEAFLLTRRCESLNSMYSGAGVEL